MSGYNNLIDSFDASVNNAMSIVDNNKYLSTGLALFLVLYAVLAAPKLPTYIARLFDNTFFKIFIFFLIAYSAHKDPTVAIIAAIGVMVSLHTLNRIKVGDRVMNMMQSEEQHD